MIRGIVKKHCIFTVSPLKFDSLIPKTHEMRAQHTSILIGRSMAFLDKFHVFDIV